MIMNNRQWGIVSFLVVFVVWGGKDVVWGATVQEKCGNDFQKLAVCLSYATGKAVAPTKDCCDSVKGIKDSEPECLCYIMQQTHIGSDQIKSMGIQEAKLIQLPTTCALKNASLTECPKLLGLAPNSPDAAIFTNATSATPGASTTPGTPATGTGTSQSQSSKPSSATKLGPHVAALLALAMAIVFLAFPAKSSDYY
ncbi:Bifunctional inhibitor/plant lipid transfer protein/seed storage helical domain containing protein [Trema orientale]|uniref:Bifunctional inhibitor/plant lipid transfer protein/seed storage helical domain containing protein n=1 Tax=Trema orientale TaxID=63057 RepID=A0A2P5C1V7_TREOI|nr:Bifunctional inhibitor/plant lipid transfer protein/seed storage helical domain containing protein [Trema orientale]